MPPGCWRSKGWHGSISPWNSGEATGRTVQVLWGGGSVVVPVLPAGTELGAWLGMVLLMGGAQQDPHPHSKLQVCLCTPPASHCSLPWQPPAWKTTIYGDITPNSVKGLSSKPHLLSRFGIFNPKFPAAEWWCLGIFLELMEEQPACTRDLCQSNLHLKDQQLVVWGVWRRGHTTGERLFTRMCSNRTKESSFTLQEKRF